jgi:sulfite reductase (NADPH) flavoprotein alpha-component
VTARQIFPTDSLTLDQKAQIDALSGSVSVDQARWISGYFAGLEAGLARVTAGGGASEAAVMPSASSRTLTILHGGETGNSAGVAKALGIAATARGLVSEIVELSRFKPRRLKESQDLLVIVSTHGEGDPPQPALEFFEYVEGPKAPRLDGVRFAILALGDSTYEQYCEAGKRLDRTFERLGATRLAARVDCDVDYEEPASAWSRALLDVLARDVEDASVRSSAIAISAAPEAVVYDKRRPFPARIIDNRLIVGRHSSKETRHIEFDIGGSGLVYEPGDSLGLAVRNDPRLAAALIDAAGLSGDAELTIHGEATTLGQALEEHFEIAVTAPRFLDHWAKLTGAEALGRLRAEDRRAERLDWLHANQILDIVRQYPLGGLDAGQFVAGLRPLQPRLYSIASSLSAVPDEAHLTLSPVRYALHGEQRSGVASAQLADRSVVGDLLPVYVQPNPSFRLPEDDAPIIMVGAGTGVAPYRAFLQEREAREVAGRSWLFLGERNFRSDFLYQAEWQAWLKSGVLERMDVAFSRDRAHRAYVQHRMLERGAELFDWIEHGAVFYVCGDAAQMAPDVHETLIQIVAGNGAMPRDAAEDYVRNLQRTSRYRRDVY